MEMKEQLRKLEVVCYKPNTYEQEFHTRREGLCRPVFQEMLSKGFPTCIATLCI